MLLALPPPVRREIGAGGEVLGGENPDGELVERGERRRHGAQAVSRSDRPSTALRELTDTRSRRPRRVSPQGFRTEIAVMKR